MSDETTEAAPDAAEQPLEQPEVLPPSPVLDAAPEPDPGIEEAPRPVAWYRVRLVAPHGTVLPLFEAGRYWHQGSEYTLPQDVVDALPQGQGFAVLGGVEAPAPRKSP